MVVISAKTLCHCLLAAALFVPARPADSREQGQASGDAISISGSSTLYPFSRAAIQAYAAANRQPLPLQAEAIGTSAGLRRFCKGSSSMAAASRPINAAELRACAAQGIQFLELPVAYDAITVVVNGANSWAREISTNELRRLWNRNAEGKIVRWQQVKPSWPNKPISLCAPGRDSGTYDTFNKAINGQIDNARQDVTTSEDDDVLVRCVAKNPLAMGYFGYDYYQANRSSLRALAVHGLRGSVSPSEASVQRSRYLPLSRPLFLYVNAEALRQRPQIRQFISFTLERGSHIARQARVIPLQDSTYRLVLSKLYRQVLGSAFAGDLPIGLTVGQTLERSFDALKKPQYR